MHILADQVSDIVFYRLISHYYAAEYKEIISFLSISSLMYTVGQKVTFQFPLLLDAVIFV